MNELELFKRMEAIMDVAAEVLLEEKQVVPVLSVFKDGKVGVLPLPFGASAKEIMFLAAREFMMQMKPEAAVFVSEAWVSVIKRNAYASGSFPFQRPSSSEDMEREERLLVVGAMDGSCQVLAKRILRTPDGSPYADDADPIVISHGASSHVSIFDGVFEPVQRTGYC